MTSTVFGCGPDHAVSSIDAFAMGKSVTYDGTPASQRGKGPLAPRFIFVRLRGGRGGAVVVFAHRTRQSVDCNKVLHVSTWSPLENH